jgi:hypothetical protein
MADKERALTERIREAANSARSVIARDRADSRQTAQRADERDARIAKRVKSWLKSARGSGRTR